MQYDTFVYEISSMRRAAAFFIVLLSCAGLRTLAQTPSGGGGMTSHASAVTDVGRDGAEMAL